MSQPANLPRWSDTVAGDTSRVVDPPASKKDVGWNVQERPAAQHINWLLYTVYLWIVYLKNLAGEAFTWTAAHVFSNTVTCNNTLLASSTGLLSVQGLYRHASRTMHVPVGSAVQGEAGAGSWTYSAITATATPSWTKVGATAKILYLPIPVRRGERVTAFRVRIYIDVANTAAAQVQCIAYRSNDVVTVIDLANSVSGAGYQTVTITPAATSALAAVDQWNLGFTSVSANHRIELVEVDYDRP